MITTVYLRMVKFASKLHETLPKSNRTLIFRSMPSPNRIVDRAHQPAQLPPTLIRVTVCSGRTRSPRGEIRSASHPPGGEWNAARAKTTRLVVSLASDATRGTCCLHSTTPVRVHPAHSGR